jgi:hypothetical protein
MGAVGDSQFTEEPIDVRLNGGFRDGEIGGDFLIGAAGDDSFEDAQFAGGKRLPTDTFR